MGFRIEFDREGLNQRLEQGTLSKRYFKSVSKVFLRDFGSIFRDQLIKKRLSGRPGLKQKTGALSNPRNYTFTIVGRREDTLQLIITIGSRSKYARIQDEGGTITARKGFLTIPLPPIVRPGDPDNSKRSPRVKPDFESAKESSQKSHFRIFSGKNDLFLGAAVEDVSGVTLNPDYIIGADVGKNKKGYFEKRSSENYGIKTPFILLWLLRHSVRIPPRMKVIDFVDQEFDKSPQLESLIKSTQREIVEAQKRGF